MARRRAFQVEGTAKALVVMLGMALLMVLGMALLFVLLFGLLLGAAARPARADTGGTTTENQASVGFTLKSVFAPRLRRGTTRVYATVRPFLSVLGQGAGAIADMGVDHYFVTWPVRLSLEVVPLALAIEADGPGSVGHVRFGGALATDYVELGGSVGSRIQNYGGAGISLASSLRLGAVDGLRFTISYGYLVKNNQFTGKVRVGMSSVLTGLQVPVGATLALFAESGISAEKWIYASVGLRHRLIGDGGAGTWIISGSFGIAWVIDRPECPYPDTGWCTDSAWAAGPTLGLGLEHRF